MSGIGGIKQKKQQSATGNYRLAGETLRLRLFAPQAGSTPLSAASPRQGRCAGRDRLQDAAACFMSPEGAAENKLVPPERTMTFVMRSGGGDAGQTDFLVLVSMQSRAGFFCAEEVLSCQK